jgi:topoisomerase IA-like protein
MENVNKAVELAQAFLSEKAAYDAKPTKAASKRMRSALNEMKKTVTAAKADLIAADHAPTTAPTDAPTAALTDAPAA